MYIYIYMYIYICIYIYVYIYVYIYICIYICIYIYVYIYIYMYTYMVCVCIYMYTYPWCVCRCVCVRASVEACIMTCICIHLCMCIWYMYIYTYIYIYLCVCVYILIYIYTYIFCSCSHTFIQTYIKSFHYWFMSFFTYAHHAPTAHPRSGSWRGAERPKVNLRPTKRWSSGEMAPTWAINVVRAINQAAMPISRRNEWYELVWTLQNWKFIDVYCWGSLHYHNLKTGNWMKLDEIGWNWMKLDEIGSSNLWWNWEIGNVNPLLQKHGSCTGWFQRCDLSPKHRQLASDWWHNITHTASIIKLVLQLRCWPNMSLHCSRLVGESVCIVKVPFYGLKAMVRMHW